jgi:hypothetical protein
MQGLKKSGVNPWDKKVHLENQTCKLATILCDQRKKVRDEKEVAAAVCFTKPVEVPTAPEASARTIAASQSSQASASAASAPSIDSASSAVETMADAVIVDVSTPIKAQLVSTAPEFATELDDMSPGTVRALMRQGKTSAVKFSNSSVHIGTKHFSFIAKDRIAMNDARTAKSLANGTEALDKRG